MPAGAAGGARTEELDATETRGLVRRGLRSDEREVRVAAVTALCGLAREHEWALDGLVEALASELDARARRHRARPPRAAPGPPARSPPLASERGRPVLRRAAARPLSRDLARRHVVTRTGDASPHVRAAALETLRAAGSSRNAAACARAPLRPASLRPGAGEPQRDGDRPPRRRFLRGALARRRVMVGAGGGSEALVELGLEVASIVSRLLDAPDPVLRKGAALVLQDVGAIDARSPATKRPASSSGSWRPRRSAPSRRRRAARRRLDLASTAGASLERAS